MHNLKLTVCGVQLPAVLAKEKCLMSALPVSIASGCKMNSFFKLLDSLALQRKKSEGSGDIAIPYQFSCN